MVHFYPRSQLDRHSLMFLHKCGRIPITISSKPMTSILIDKTKVIRIYANVLFSLQKVSHDADQSTASTISLNFGYVSWSSLSVIAFKLQKPNAVFSKYYGPLLESMFCRKPAATEYLACNSGDKKATRKRYLYFVIILLVYF